ncbi:hypothetical protein AAE02nite_29520 [Adhaeribacter aerolatus]|uniref:YdhG-like domain-containing protein n=1 Tax=Adhaeribacter aerolatus TaxID=670289 RepID=A0A512B006_9BACT|nr:DUF1801 domain-containing protein [Adhaeribacter aerolatus]GEO05288.1 hypothetical protein AAE02nite_29520 [Adhaeribacter aerolatus]
MRSAAITPQAYLDTLPADRKHAMSQLREILLENLPAGFAEVMNYGMIGYVVPHTLYAPGYHCNPEEPLPFINIASQKNFVALYHMGLYAAPDLLAWFTQEYPKHVKTKPDMGKSCIRFKKMAGIPYVLIGQLASKLSPQQWIALYESQLKK